MVLRLFTILFPAFILINTQLKAQQNLIINPGAELPINNGWILISGNWKQGKSGSIETHVFSREGQYYFYAGAASSNSDDTLYQIIDVSDKSLLIDKGIAVFEFSGYVQSYGQAVDDAAKEIVEYIDELGKILYAFDSDWKTSVGSWDHISDLHIAPVGTRRIRVKLVSQVHTGSNDNAYHDDLSLIFSIDSTCLQTICGTVDEYNTLTMTAPNGGVFTSIDFASYGLPEGSCGNFSYSSCHSDSTKRLIDSIAIGKNSFSVYAGNEIFGDPCQGITKRLYIQATSTCSSTKQSQTITFDPIAPKIFGDTPFVIHALASSGLPVTYQITSGPAYLSRDTITILGADTVTVVAKQEGNDEYYPASESQTFAIIKAIQEINFVAAIDSTAQETKYIFSATSTSHLPVYFKIVAGPGEISDDTVLTFHGSGAVIGEAYQPGNNNYERASIQQTFCADPVAPGMISGYSQTCKGQRKYNVGQQDGVLYEWVLSGGGSLNSTTGNSVIITWNTIGTFILTVTASTNCGTATYSQTKTINVIDNITPGAVSNMYPPNGTVISVFPFSLSWKPGSNSEMYDVFVWEYGTPKPAYPLDSTEQIAYSLSQSDFHSSPAGKTYNWQITAKNGCSGTEGPIQTFTVAELPNLVALNIQVADTIYSGKEIDFKAEVKNIGPAPTPMAATWQDAFYLSIGDSLDRLTNIYLGSKPNITDLKPDSSYTTEMQYLLPEISLGDQYLFVVPNAFNNLSESNSNDNRAYKKFYIKPSSTPDLQVINVAPANEGFSGEKLHLTYQVQDIDAETYNDSVWKDYIYISPDQTFADSESIKLFEITHYGKLASNGTYSIDTVITIPPYIFGNYYIHVFTDARDDVYESGREKNNISTGGIVTIYLTPPPDFIVSAVNVSADAVPGESINVDYTVYSAGASKPTLFGNSWSDGIFLSHENIFNDKAIKLAEVTPYPLPVMEAGESYSNTATIKIPSDFVGPGYIYVLADYHNNIFEYYHDDNNTGSDSIQVNAPNLYASSLDAPDSVSSGNDIEVNWSVTNSGNGRVLPINRTDRIWLCTTSQFDASRSSVLKEITYNTSLDTNASVSKYTSVSIGQAVAGQQYLFIETDAHNNIYETDENNNFSNGHSLYVSPSPSPDLIVSNVLATPDSVITNNTYTVTYTVQNQGTGNVTGKTWVDRIYRSTDSVFNNNAISIKDITESRTLYSGDTYSETSSFILDLADLENSDTTKWHFFVHADISDNIYEAAAEGNNISSSNYITAVHNPYPDLTVTQAQGSNAVQTGKLTTINWTVNNIAGKEGLSNYWYDAVFFSEDQILSDNDIFAGSKAIYNPFQTADSYSQIMNITVPNGISGSYYMLLVTDYTKLNIDTNRSNNTKPVKTIVSVGGNDTIIVHVDQSASPNLIASSFTAPSSGYSGQPVSVKWTISNTGDTSVGKSYWNENIYLSTDDQVDANDQLLISKVHMSDLAKNETFSDSATVFLPSNAAGNYYLLFKTDGNNIVYENNNEDDNTATSFISIQIPDPGDLSVSNVVMPSQAFITDSVNVTWHLNNVGVNPSAGYLRQGIYTSKDDIWDKDDILLSDFPSQINIGPSADSVFNQNVKLDAIQPDNNFIIVRTDLLNNIYETNENNNITASTATINIEIPELPIGGQPTPATLVNANPLYYKIVVPDSLAGETLLVSLKGDSLNALNELYIKFDSIPTRINYDFAYPNPVSGSQDIIIPALAKGEYYLLVNGSTSSASHTQNVTLHAEIIDFEILSVDAKEGGNTGIVTVKITGAKFDENMQAILTNKSLGTYTATRIIVNNSTSVYATFNLSGAKKGIYDLSLVKPSIDTATLPQAFSMVEGSGGGIAGGESGSGLTCYIINGGVESLTEFNIDVDEKVRVNTPYITLIEFYNNGNVDVELPLVQVQSLDNAPVSYEQTLFDILSGKLFDLTIDWINDNSPEGTLRPGAKAYSIVYSVLPFDKAHYLYNYQLIGK